MEDRIEGTTSGAVAHGFEQKVVYYPAERPDQDAMESQWIEAMGGEAPAREVLDFPLSNHALSKTEDGKYRWYRSVHCGPRVIEHVRVDDVPDYNG